MIRMTECKMWLMEETHVKWSTARTDEQWHTWPWHGRQHATTNLNMGHELQQMHGDHSDSNCGPSACQADEARAEM